MTAVDRCNIITFFLGIIMLFCIFLCVLYLGSLGQLGLINISYFQSVYFLENSPPLFLKYFFPAEVRVLFVNFRKINDFQ